MRHWDKKRKGALESIYMGAQKIFIRWTYGWKNSLLGRRYSLGPGNHQRPQDIWFGDCTREGKGEIVKDQRKLQGWDCNLFFFFFLTHSWFNLINLFMFWPHHVACGILVPRPGIEPGPPALGMWSLTHWTTRDVPLFHFNTWKNPELGKILR